MLKEARVEPPFQTAYFLSAEAITLISAPAGARATISFLSLSGSPSYIVVPPERMMFLQRSFLTSISEAETEAQESAWIDLQDLPFKLGLNSNSGQDIRT